MFDDFKIFLKSEVCEKIVHIKAAHIWQRFYSFSAHKSDVIALYFFLANSRCTLRMTTVLWLHNLFLLLSFACISPGMSSCVLKRRFRYFPLICAGMKLLCLRSSFWIYRGVIFVFRCLCSDSGFLVKRPSESQGFGGMSPWADRALGDKGAVVLHSCVFSAEKALLRVLFPFLLPSHPEKKKRLQPPLWKWCLNLLRGCICARVAMSSPCRLSLQAHIL